MPLMREFGGLERKRLGDGVCPPRRIPALARPEGPFGQNFAKSRHAGLSAMGGDGEKTRPTRMLVEYQTRDHLTESIASNVQPAGFFGPTPFAARF